jgi:site-specific DNA recombinase
MYVDKLDGAVDAAFLEKCRTSGARSRIAAGGDERHQQADKSYLDSGVALLDLARNAQTLFAKQEPREKRRLLNFVLSNCNWEEGEVVTTFRQPFDMLAETATAAACIERDKSKKSAKTEIWLGN